MAEEDKNSPFDKKKKEKESGEITPGELDKYIREHPEVIEQIRRGYGIFINTEKNTTDIKLPDDKDKKGQ